MDLIIETDLGGDPDDFFAICYLISAGAKIRLLNLSPGTTRQVAIARFIFDRLGLDVPIGVPDTALVDRKNKTDMHSRLLSANKAPQTSVADGRGAELLRSTLDSFPKAELFLIGPLLNLNEYLASEPLFGNRVTMQGGFVAYHMHDVPCRRAPKFEGHTYYRTFNLNGCVEGGKRLLLAEAERFFVGKNVCHLAIYDREMHRFFEDVDTNEPMKLFVEAAEHYFEKKGSKKFHDPLAAVALTHPEILTWLSGELRYQHGAWGTFPIKNGDQMAVDVDIDAFWEHLIQGK